MSQQTPEAIATTRKTQSLRSIGIALIMLVGVMAVSSSSRDKKRHIVVRAENSSQQVNNHPWSYTSPGRSSTNCSTDGTVNATGTTIGNTTDVNGTVNANTDCTSTYRPPQTTTGNRVTVDNSAWVTDINSGDQYLIQCSANWAGSKCAQVPDGGEYKAAIEGNNIWITGLQGMKEVTAKYHILQFTPGSQPATSGPIPSGPSSPRWVTSGPSSSRWTEGSLGSPLLHYFM